MPNELLVIKRFHETTGDAPTAHTGLAFCSRCHPPWHRSAHWWVPARTPTVHQCPHSGKAVGGIEQSSRDTTNTRRPRLPRHALATNICFLIVFLTFFIVFHFIYFFTFLTFLTVLRCFFYFFAFFFFYFFYLLLSFREEMNVTECL